MDPKRSNPNTVEAPFSPWTAKTNEIVAHAAPGLLGPGPEIRGLLGPGAQGNGSQSDGPFCTETSDERRAEINRFGR